MSPLLGNSFLFASNNAKWKAKRQACSHAFYRNKLIGMMEHFKGLLSNYFEQWTQEIKSEPHGFKVYDISKVF